MAANRLKENNQPISASMCAACPEQKTKEQSIPQSKKNKQNNCGKLLQAGKNNQHMWPVTAASKEKTKQWWPAGINNNNQPSLSRKKSSCESGGNTPGVGEKPISQQESKH